MPCRGAVRKTGRTVPGNLQMYGGKQIRSRAGGQGHSRAGRRERAVCRCAGKVRAVYGYHAESEITDVFRCLEAVQWEPTDLIVAIGGGSTIDVAKCVSALKRMMRGGLTLEKVADAIRNKKYLGNDDVIDIVAVPTTAGTGSDVTKWATVWDMEEGKKLSVDSPLLYPKVSLQSADMTMTMPPKLTLSTGLDALSHAMESFWARARTPVNQEIALSAISIIRDYLPKVMENGDDRTAREKMMLGALLAGIAFSCTRTTACHSISYPLTMEYKVPHGFAAALTLYDVAKLNEKDVPEIARIWELFGGRDGFKKWMNGRVRGGAGTRTVGFRRGPGRYERHGGAIVHPGADGQQSQ